MEYAVHILVLIVIYSLLSSSLNLIAGYTGLLSLAHAAFFGVGAYATALTALHLHTPLWLNMALATGLSGVLGAVISAPSLRVRDEYFVVASLAFQVIAFSVLNNCVVLTGGPDGLPGIPQPVILGYKVASPLAFLGFCIPFWVALLWICWLVTTSPVGRVLKAIREDEIMVQAVGKNVACFKIIVFVIGAMIAAVAGALYASYVTFIDPTSFTLAESIFIISIVIIGGAGGLCGPVVGAVVLVALPELLRFVGMPSSVAANVRQMLYGGLLVAFMMWRPQGLWGRYAFEKKSAGA